MTTRGAVQWLGVGLRRFGSADRVSVFFYWGIELETGCALAEVSSVII